MLIHLQMPCLRKVKTIRNGLQIRLEICRMRLSDARIASIGSVLTTETIVAKFLTKDNQTQIGSVLTGKGERNEMPLQRMRKSHDHLSWCLPRIQELAGVA